MKLTFEANQKQTKKLHRNMETIATELHEIFTDWFPELRESYVAETEVTKNSVTIEWRN